MKQGHSVALKSEIPSITNKGATLEWGTSKTIATIGSTNITATLPANPNTHQAIKTLKTDNTAAQPTNASEAIAGSGTINLHKVAKTGSYNDLNDKPTIPDISGLVPYDGATHDVILVNHALVISDKTSADGAVAGIKVSGKGVSEDDVWTTIKPNGIRMESPSISYANLSSSELTISDGAQSGSVTENGFKVTTPEDTSVYGYDGITHNGKKLSFPAKAGTFLLNSDLNSSFYAPTTAGTTAGEPTRTTGEPV